MKWYALYVNSRAEKKVTEILIGKNIVAYIPIVKTLKQWSDRKKIVELPLINGYVFVKINDSDNDKVLQTQGVVNFVKHEGKNAVIRDVEIERLKQLVELGYHIEVNTAKINYNEGDKIKITSGPLKNIEGYIYKGDEVKYLEIVLESIGQSMRVKLPKDIVILVD